MQWISQPIRLTGSIQQQLPTAVYLFEVMGHKVGHVTLHAGIAGGADIILLPEIPYDIKAITNVIDRRTKAGKPFTILAVAEGAISKGRCKAEKERV